MLEQDDYELQEMTSANFSQGLICGTVAGIAQVFVGQPFDIVKVRLQSSNEYPSAINCATRILREEGPLAFYKGTTMPLIGIGACVSLQFGFLEAGKSYFVRKNKEAGASNPELFSSGQLFAAGAMAGLGNVAVSGPVEHIRIRMQTQKQSVPLKYTGPIQALTSIYRADGIKGVYQGLTPTVLREAIGYGMYFWAYEWLVQRELVKNHIERKDIPMSSAMLYGAMAGYAMWLTNYPLDVVKSCMQTDGFRSEGTRAYSSTLDCVKKLYAKNGWRAFTRGLGPTLIRSPFVNASTFAVYELTMGLIA